MGVNLTDVEAVVAGELASWGRRLAALMIDSVVLATIITVTVLAGGVAPGELNTRIRDGESLLVLLLFVVPEAIYTTALIGSLNQTFGKMAVGIKVVDAEDRSPIGYTRAFTRWLSTAFLWALLVGAWNRRSSVAVPRPSQPDVPRQVRAKRGGAHVSDLDKQTEDRIDEPVSEEAVRETRLTPAQAVEKMHINLPVRGNRKLRKLLERVNEDKQLKGWWHVANVNAVVRMEINDHSWVHIQIVANIALKLLRQLTKHGIEPSAVRDFGLEQDDAEVIVALSSLFHCVGMSVHRHGHEDFSLFLSEPKMRELLRGIYEEPELTVVISEVLQAITSHRADGQPLALEAGILRVADALDMAEGRSRIPFEKGRVSMHSLSAAAIDDVSIKDGESHPVMIEIVMNNSSGLFQVDGLLKAKLIGSGLEPYVEVIAHIDTEAEKRLVPIYRLET